MPHWTRFCLHNHITQDCLQADTALHEPGRDRVLGQHTVEGPGPCSVLSQQHKILQAFFLNLCNKDYEPVSILIATGRC